MDVFAQGRVMNSQGVLEGFLEEVTPRQGFGGWIGVAQTRQERE